MLCGAACFLSSFASAVFTTRVFSVCQRHLHVSGVHHVVFSPLALVQSPLSPPLRLRCRLLHFTVPPGGFPLSSALLCLFLLLFCAHVGLVFVLLSIRFGLVIVPVGSGFDHLLESSKRFCLCSIPVFLHQFFQRSQETGFCCLIFFLRVKFPAVRLLVSPSSLRLRSRHILSGSRGVPYACPRPRTVADLSQFSSSCQHNPICRSANCHCIPGGMTDPTSLTFLLVTLY